MTTTVDVPERPSEYLNCSQAGEYLQMSPRTLERWRIYGTGPVYIKVGKGIRAKVLYRKADIDSWLETNEHQKTDEYVKRKKEDDSPDEPEGEHDSANRLSVEWFWVRMDAAFGKLVRPWSTNDLGLGFGSDSYRFFCQFGGSLLGFLFGDCFEDFSRGAGGSVRCSRGGIGAS